MAWRKPGNLREWVNILLTHKKKFIFPALGVTTAIVLGSFALQREYRAETKFERRNENVMTTEKGKIQNVMQETLRRLLIEDLAGKPAIEQLISDMGFDKNLPRREDSTLTDEGMRMKAQMIEDYQSRLAVKFQTRSDLIDVVTVLYTDKDSRVAPEVANRLVDNYVRKTREKLEGTLANAEIFLKKEVDRYRADVQELERKKIRFETENVGLRPDDALAVQNRKNELIAQRNALAQEIEVKKAELSRLEEFVRGQPENITTENVGRNPVYDQILTQKGEAEKELSDHINFGRTEEHPLVKKARARIAELNAKLAATPPETKLGEQTSPNNNRIQAMEKIKTMEGTIEAKVAQKAAKDEEVVHYENMDRQFLALRAEWVRMTRDLDEATSQLKVWEENLSRASIALKTEVSARGQRFTVIQRAEIAPSSKPTLIGVLVVALGAGLGVGVLMILLAELLDHSFRSIDQAVDELKLPVLGAIAEISTPARAMKEKIFAWAVMPAIGAAMLMVLLVSIWMVYLSLEKPQQFQQLFSRFAAASSVDPMVKTS
ncbi:MAG: hypothetical protein IT444_01130 [Phycisphaeraceae bacterium]|nr:hypothetical protein [Phycisphaeraceae bacterium]